MPGNQSSLSALLSDKIAEVKPLLGLQDGKCVDLVFRIACHYYLPPCGNSVLRQSPTSVCQEECEYVKSTCLQVWQIASVVFDLPLSFLSCDDTSHLLFPLPSCCTGIGIELPENHG